MAFFSNKTINYLNLHLALVNLLDQSYNVFVPIYLYTHGFSLAGVFALIALMMALRAPLRFLSIPLAHRFGLAPLVMTGAAGYALTFPVLSMAHGMDGWLALYILLFALTNSMHWLCYHTFYTLAGEHEKRGRQVAVAQALSAGLAAIAPILSALTIDQAGFTRYFLCAFVLMALMLFALRHCGNIVPPAVPWHEGKKEMFNLGARIHVVEAAASYPLNICWILVVYLYVGKIVSFGGIVAFGVVVQILYQLLLGSWVDRGKGTLIVHAAGSLRGTLAVARALLPLSLSRILGLEALSAISLAHFQAVEPTVLYNAGKQSGHPLWYWLFTETGWDIGTVIGAGGSALLLWLGMDLRHIILIAPPSLLILWWLLYRYLREHSFVRPLA